MQRLRLTSLHHIACCDVYLPYLAEIVFKIKDGSFSADQRFIKHPEHRFEMFGIYNP